MSHLKPLKKFGQNYLRDPNILRKIIEEISPDPGDNIVEIGPGTGALTELLVQRAEKITAVEIDRRVIDDLIKRFPSVTIIEDDFLNTDLHKIRLSKQKKIRIVGNIPYNLTSPILFKMIENNHLVQDSILMVQYEVAKRMIARPGNKDCGILSVLLSYFTEVRLAFKVSPNVFYPRPKVDSAVVHLTFSDIKQSTEFQRTFIRIVKASFGNRRKMLRNSLSNSIFAEINFSGAGIDLSKRAEQLLLEDFIILTRFVLTAKPDR